MRTMVILAVLLLSYMGCAKPPTDIKEPDPYEFLTPSYTEQFCGKAKETYVFPLVGNWYFISRYKKCNNIDDLFSVQWMGEVDELRVVSARLVVLLYIDYLVQLNDDSNTLYSYRHLKLHEDTEGEPNATFFEIIELKKQDQGEVQDE